MGYGLFPVKYDVAAMHWCFVILEGGFAITDKMVEVIGSKFCKTLWGEVGVCWMIKSIQVGHVLCELLLIMLS